MEVRKQLPTSRSWWKFILLSPITLGIYPLVVMFKIADEINAVAGPHDGLKTMDYVWVLVLSPFTLGILPFVWFHKLANRMGAELHRRGIAYDFSASTFWLWSVVGALIGVGPIVFIAKFLKAMNLLNADYNEKG
ncbi:MAG: DUF4234 domain-containing protein [Paludibacteraceae bacterium]|jgi:hypothetical protein|nr:DUF4234 domain-containing protein [Paludibacteraceae bacterium]